jgi:hypothetical protein
MFTFASFNIFVNNKNMKDMVATRLDPEIKKLLEKMAAEQHRPLSNLIRLIILEWLEFKGIKIPKSKLPYQTKP